MIELALFADDGYDAVARRLAATFTDLDVVGLQWEPTTGGLTKAHQRLGAAPLAELFGRSRTWTQSGRSSAGGG